jgi:hypothetical protein
MNHPHISSISSVKLAWAVSWPAFWTGVPFKMSLVLLLLSMQVHPWEGAGLAALLVISIPIDIWALGLTARTVFLERLGIDVKGPDGAQLWLQGAVLGTVVLGASYYVVGGAVTVGQSVAHSIFGAIKKMFPGFPVAEQITLELLIWGIPAVIIAILMGIIWLKLFGWRIKRYLATHAQAGPVSFLDRVRQWDAARVPADQALMLVSFTGVVCILTVAFWVFLPETTTHRHPDYPPLDVVKVKKPMKPEEVLQKTDMSLAKAEAVLEVLEKEKAADNKKKPSGKGK